MDRSRPRSLAPKLALPGVKVHLRDAYGSQGLGWPWRCVVWGTAVTPEPCSRAAVGIKYCSSSLLPTASHLFQLLRPLNQVSTMIARICLAYCSASGSLCFRDPLRLGPQATCRSDPEVQVPRLTTTQFSAQILWQLIRTRTRRALNGRARRRPAGILQSLSLTVVWEGPQIP